MNTSERREEMAGLRREIEGKRGYNERHRDTRDRDERKQIAANDAAIERAVEKHNRLRSLLPFWIRWSEPLVQ